MNILYLGAGNGTSRHRQLALMRLGHEVDAIDLHGAFRDRRRADQWLWHMGGIGLEPRVRRHVLSRLRRERYHACIADPGDLVGPSLLRALRPRVGRLIQYNADNPFVARDGRRWRIMLRALRHYDLFATPRVTTAGEVARRGVRAFRYVQAADEVVHRPRPENAADRAIYPAEVAFVGTWMPERGPFMVQLLDAGIDLRIFGANWRKAPEYARLQPFVVLDGMLDDEAYVRAIQYARIALGFVSLGNEDLHTNRSVEIPAIGTLLCARRTSQHLELYRDREEAVFWDDAAECAAKCRELLDRPERLARIAAAGASRQRGSGNWNERLLTNLLDCAFDRPAAAGEATC